MVEMKGSYSSLERLPGKSEHLNIVEVKCNVVDGRILKVLKFLSAFNIRKLTNDAFRALCILKLAYICEGKKQAVKKKHLNYVGGTACRDTNLSES